MGKWRVVCINMTSGYKMDVTQHRTRWGARSFANHMQRISFTRGGPLLYVVEKDKKK